MRILDSRRLTGPSLLLDRPGAILDVALDGVSPAAAEAAWRAELTALLAALGLPPTRVAARAYAGGMSLAFTAPLDVLYAATEVNEAAWLRAARVCLPADPQAAEELAVTVARLEAALATERKPWLLALDAEARRRGVTLLADDKRVSVGLGTGSRSWPIEESAAAIPQLPWAALHDVPVALVTGTNGKTTSVRLLGAVARAAGHTAGVTSTDSITVDDEVVAEGDYSGPNGARTVLRDRRVGVAVLEVARGGILRRGLAVPRARVALVTNVAADHLGEYGVHDLPGLADVKLVVAKAVGPDGRVVLNANDPLLLERGRRLEAPVIWFSLDAEHATIREHAARGGETCVLDGDMLVFARGGERRSVVRAGDVPFAFGGAARHTLANALGVSGAAVALGYPDAAIRRALTSFDNDAERNPGRANIWHLNGVTAIVDYAHNPHGLAALAAMVATLPAVRRALVIGQAGDRDDDAIRELARTGHAARPDRVFIKEMESFLRGREKGVVPALLEAEFSRLGVPGASISRHADETAAVRAALEWARDGDLLLLTSHAQRDQVIALLKRLAENDWRPGEPTG